MPNQMQVKTVERKAFGIGLAIGIIAGVAMTIAFTQILHHGRERQREQAEIERLKYRDIRERLTDNVFAERVYVIPSEEYQKIRTHEQASIAHRQMGCAIKQQFDVPCSVRVVNETR